MIFRDVLNEVLLLDFNIFKIIYLFFFFFTCLKVTGHNVFQKIIFTICI